MQLDPTWEYVTDGVMGGVSQGGMHREVYRGRAATLLRGKVSLDNNGGFLQLAFDLTPGGGAFDAAAWDGLAFALAGNGEAYDIRLRTTQLTRPWQSFRHEVTTKATWRTWYLTWDDFAPHRTEARFDPSQLRRVGLLAVGRAFRAELAVGAVHLFRAADT